ncbi:sugar phosphate isomerase/epimerase [Cohnella sp. REN36]|uniref:sugar phosphate isomerase/epimerase family protein n=1 Tax=Cohnella sp. REN36 TaxID=2887347 RepID=UPI001D14AD67|nr:TIM barrel protein [Cohnella sp. REN36]MCC3372069.1 sugar phosphate isomerase/epimerase [Cohnella sp. REN36]
MRVLRFKSLWEYVGFEGSPLAIRMPADIGTTFERIARAGYQGVECPLPVADQEPLFRQLLREYGLSYIAQVLTDGPDHATSFDLQVKRASAFEPFFIVSQSGKDSDSPERQLAFFERALQTEAEIGIPVAHETHRGRALYTPWHAAYLLGRLERLKLNADFSHWCCVAESLLEEHEERMTLACRRSLHIHGRIGHREGPQVADPRAPEYGYELSVHEGWWKRVVMERISQGAEAVTFTPEFGPPGYMPTLPYTKQPIADLWELNLWMADRFERLAGEAAAEWKEERG